MAIKIEKRMAVNARTGVPRINKNFWIKVISKNMKPKPIHVAKSK